MRTFKNHNRKWSIIITVLVLLLAFIGSYQYYNDPLYVGTVVPDRLWSSVLYSAMKLYAFSSTVGPGKNTPLTYEIAMWLAPLCTAYWIFQILESLFRHQICIVHRVFSSKKQIIVFGYNEKSSIFLQNLITSQKKRRCITLISKNELARDTRLMLERNHVLIYQMDLLEDSDFLLKQDFDQLHLENAAEVVLFYEDATRNFALLNKLLALVEREGPSSTWRRLEGSIYCSVFCEDRIMRKIITDYYDGVQSPKPFDIHLFAMAEIAADALVQAHPFYENCLSWSRQQAAANGKDINELLEHTPQPHVLIVGFGSYGQAVFEKALLTGILSDRSKIPGYEQLRITILDENIQQCQNILETQYPGIHNICRVSCIEGDAGSIRVIRELAKLPSITYAVICLSGQTCGINILERLQSCLCAQESSARSLSPRFDVPIAIRMKTDDAVIRCRYQSKSGAAPGIRITSFGTDRELLTYEHVVKSQLEESAKAFHALYQRISAQINGQAPDNSTVQEMWNRLSFEKKESCRAQVLNVPWFCELLSMLPPLPDKQKTLAGGERTEEFLRRLAAQPALKALSMLEHRRWCGFCYAYGYAGSTELPSEKGREHWITTEDLSLFGKVHPCLITDWDIFLRTEYNRKTVIYDVCSIYSYAEALSG